MLAKQPGQIKVGEILTALEGEFSIIDELNVKEKQDAIQSAIQELVWDRINHSIRDFLDECTLAELVEQHEKMNSAEEWMYYI